MKCIFLNCYFITDYNFNVYIYILYTNTYKFELKKPWKVLFGWFHVSYDFRDTFDAFLSKTISSHACSFLSINSASDFGAIVKRMFPPLKWSVILQKWIMQLVLCRRVTIRRSWAIDVCILFDCIFQCCILCGKSDSRLQVFECLREATFSWWI